MVPRLGRCLLAVLSILFLIHFAHGQRLDLVGRDDSTAPTTTSDPTVTGKDDGASTTSSVRPTGDSKHTAATASSSSTEESKSSSSTSHHPAPTATSTIIDTTDGPLDNSTFYNVTIPEGQLPLVPELTPGWGVAGTFMLLSGLAYTLIGIKNRWVHTFFSTAYLAALGITVLIVYVMNVPVSKALQGGYVAAIIVSASAAGAASSFFKEMIEGFGCAAGGFCVSMWLLTLSPGGLLQATVSKAIFMCAFTAVAFAFYFSHYTRDWALITMIAFCGATVAVLGIDCFSKAGLKEFWAYIWDLNDDLFPLGATTYPVTKGIRVETAAIIILCVVGIISQIKLWKIVREQKAKRAEERAEAQRQMDVEEANLGRRVEEMNARDRARWERVYGDGDEFGGTTVHSDAGDAASEKRKRGSRVGSPKRASVTEAIEMTDMTDLPAQEPEPLMSGGGEKEGKVTVRVAEDEVRPPSLSNEGELDEKATEAPQQQTRESGTTAQRQHSTRAASMTQPPEVVPLPFRVPTENTTKPPSERSSIATFADDVDVPSPTAQNRLSMAKRLSQGSASLLRSLSQMSMRAPNDVATQHQGESSEDLIDEVITHAKDDNESLAATADHESLSGSERLSIGDDELERRSIEINAQLSEQDERETREHAEEEPAGQEAEPAAVESKLASSKSKQQRRLSAMTASSGVNPPPAGGSIAEQSQAETASRHDHTVSRHPESVLSTPSVARSLTKDKLPRSMSRVALSYRTNEWAKHLSKAETPEPDTLEVAHPKRATKVEKEPAVPVRVEELQLTAEDGVPRSSSFSRLQRSESAAKSTAEAARPASRAGSVAGAAATPLRVTDLPVEHAVTRTKSPIAATTPPAPQKRLSQSSGVLPRSSTNFAPIAEEPGQIPLARAPSVAGDHESIRSLKRTQSNLSGSKVAVAGSGPVPGVASFTTPQTLLGQRDVVMRSRSSGNLLASIQEPEPAESISVQPGSESGSLYNYPVYAAAMNADMDDVPLSQRKQIMRQNSIMSLNESRAPPPQPSNQPVMFNSHQPRRESTVPTPAQRESRLASFRQSVANDLGPSSSGVAGGLNARQSSFSSFTPLRDTAGSSLSMNAEAELQRNIEVQRSAMLSRKEAEVQMREKARQQKEWSDRAFDERMRTGDFLGAHREAMRKMQQGAKKEG